MRRFLLIYGLLFGMPTLFSQNLNFAEHEGVDRTGNMVSINSKVYYIGGYGNNCCGVSVYLKGLDKNGNTLFTSGFSGSTYNFGKVIKTLDDQLFLNFYTIKSCDQPARLDYIAKVDTNGALLFSVPIQSSAVSGFSPTIVDITQHPDSSYYLVSTSELYHYSKNGVFISKINSGLSSISSIKALSSGLLFIHGTMNSNPCNVLMQGNGSIVKQNPNFSLITKTLNYGSDYYCRTSGGLIEKYDSTLTLIRTYDANTNPSINFIKDITSRNDTLFTIGNSISNGFLLYTLLDTAFNQLYQTSGNYKGMSPTGIAISNLNNVSILSACQSKSSVEYGFSGYFQLSTHGTFNAQSDIGILGYSNLNTWLNLNQGSTKLPYIEMNVTVKNFGQDTVKSFYVNYLANYFMCRLLLHKQCQVNIAPGQTVSVATGSFYAQTFYAPSPITSKYLNICVFTSIPNQSNDINIDNDSHCDSVLFTVTGIDETMRSEQSIQIFPNPFRTDFTIQSEKEMSGYTLYNSIGESIREEKIQAREYTISKEGLSNGIYFIRIESENGRLIKKLIKND